MATDKSTDDFSIPRLYLEQETKYSIIVTEPVPLSLQDTCTGLTKTIKQNISNFPVLCNKEQAESELSFDVANSLSINASTISPEELVRTAESSYVVTPSLPSSNPSNLELADSEKVTNTSKENGDVDHQYASDLLVDKNGEHLNKPDRIVMSHEDVGNSFDKYNGLEIKTKKSDQLIGSKKFRTLVKRKSLFDGVDFNKKSKASSSCLKCGHCEKSFRSENSIIIHLRTHDQHKDIDTTNNKKSNMNDEHCVLITDKNKNIKENIIIEMNQDVLCSDAARSNQSALKSSKGPMASVGKRNAKKKIDDDFVVEQPKQKNKHLKANSSNLKHDKDKVVSQINDGKRHSELERDVYKENTQKDTHKREEKILDILMKCPHCNKCFLEHKSYSQHLLLHNGSSTSSGIQSKIEFENLQDPKSHIEKDTCSTTSGAFTCNVCLLQFMKMSELVRHKVKCTFSNNESSSVSVAQSNNSYHRKSIPRNVGFSEKKPYKCYPCNRSFKNRTLLAIHKRRHPNAVKPFKCDVCGQSFAMSKWLENHKQRHTPERKFPCDICGKSYLTKGDAVMHKKRHILDRKFHCDICQKNFVYKSELNAHLKKHQGVKQAKNISCDVCGKMFPTRRDLNRHTTVHTGEQPYQCPLCEKKFSQLVNMQTHISIHTNIKPHTCEECGKSFITKSKLQRHSIIHKKPQLTIPKPYKCVLCPCEYTAETSLVRHLRSHKRSVGTTSSVTQMLNQALEESNSNGKVSSGAVLACLIDQAIKDAKVLSKKGKHDAIDRPLAEIIDQAIIDSKAVSLGTQTPVVKEVIITASSKFDLRNYEKPSLSRSLLDSDKINRRTKSPPAFQTIVVKPKSAVVNFGPTDHRKFQQTPTALNNINVETNAIQSFPMQNIETLNTSHREKLPFKHGNLIRPNPRLVHVNPTFKPNRLRTNTICPSITPVKQYKTVPSNTQMPLIGSLYYPPPPVKQTFQTVHVQPQTHFDLSPSQGPSVLRKHNLMPENLPSSSNLILMPNQHVEVLPIQPPLDETKYFIIQTDAQGRTVFIPTTAVLTTSLDQTQHMPTELGASYHITHFPSMNNFMEDNTDNNHDSLLQEQFSTAVVQPSILQTQQVHENMVHDPLFEDHNMLEVFSYPVSITENSIDGNTQLIDMEQLNVQHNVFTTEQDLVDHKEEMDCSDDLIEFTPHFTPESLVVKPEDLDKSALFTLDNTGAFEGGAALDVSKTFINSSVVSGFDAESTNILCNVPGPTIPDGNLLEQEILQALEKRMRPTDILDNEDMVLAGVSDTSLPI